ncbi:AT-hook motif nuclear-localized protein 17 [Stylosanthes scabra]|uniref:AT-hook motif nuclear-localized protein 17 n=1 Tax=Stylosanthes scabra TaxID=79078 RepID=A0ABU6WKH8_9FABA|nr:AT-hook motif nuclear-localized protein 17 [Stylosanthes scabra]
MKGEYVEHHHLPKSEAQNMFSKLHHQSPPHQQHPFSLHNPFQHFSRDQCQPSATPEEDSHGGGGVGGAASSQKPNSSGDGATIEVVRRPRGRPPGSKNKPKPPVIITREPEPAMSPYILEVSSGNDVVEALARFSRRRNMGICVLNGSGTVANATLRQPGAAPGATVTFHGRFDILSVSATFLPQSSSQSVPTAFAISLAGPQGQIVGGHVAGGLTAATTVFVVAASFNNPSFHRLPPEDDARNEVSGGEGQSPAVSGGGGESGHGQAVDSCGMSMYSGVHHLAGAASSDVIWTPTARAPPPPY